MRNLPTKAAICWWIFGSMILYPLGSVLYVVARSNLGVEDLPDLVSFPEYWAGLVIFWALGGCAIAAVNGLNKFFKRKG